MPWKAEGYGCKRRMGWNRGCDVMIIDGTVRGWGRCYEVADMTCTVGLSVQISLQFSYTLAALKYPTRPPTNPFNLSTLFLSSSITLP